MSRTLTVDGKRASRTEVRQSVVRLERAYLQLFASADRNELNAHLGYLWDVFIWHPSADVLAKFGDRWGRVKASSEQGEGT